jgi:hypothetical protein
MAALTFTTGVTSTNGPVAVTKQTMTTSDTFTYAQGQGMVAMLYNPNLGSTVTVTFVGTSPTPINLPGGGGTFSTAGGKAVTVLNNGATFVDLDDISAYLTGNGTVTATSSLAGLFVFLFQA